MKLLGEKARGREHLLGGGWEKGPGGAGEEESPDTAGDRDVDAG